jgi:hypothetical protein
LEASFSVAAYIMASLEDTHDPTAVALRAVLEERDVRHQVGRCLTNLVTEVVEAADLSHALQAHLQQAAAAQQAAAWQQALAESYQERQRQVTTALPLADALVEDLITTSRQLGRYQALQAQHETLLSDHDACVAQLLQAQDQIRWLEEEKLRQPVGQEPPEIMYTTTAESETSPVAAQPQPSPPSVPDISSSALSSLPVVEKTVLVAKETTADLKVKTAPLETVSEIPVSLPMVSEATTEPPALQAVVSLEAADSADSAGRPPCLEDLSDIILMQTFSYLDALEILNTAQISVRMYRKVDALFGLGGPGPQASDNTTISTVDDEEGSTGNSITALTEVLPTATDRSATPVASGGLSLMPSSPGATTTTSGTAAGSATPKTGTASSATTTATTKDPLSLPPLTPPSGKQNASAVMQNVFGFLQPRSRGLTTPPRSNRAGSSNSGSNGMMNATTANAVASKLTDTELNAIVGMMERMRQKEALADKLKSENAKLKADLDGTESVKEFLVARVREMEESSVRQEDMEIKVAQQIASDQEVIAFLDARVQSLEQGAAALEAERTNATTAMATLQKNLEQKTSVLQDMLQFERERFIEYEKDAKTTKKVLVKEIKLCRNQIVALAAERDAYKEQNQTLQKAVLHTNGDRIYA